MAGHIISLYLKEQGHVVVGFARQQSKLVESVVGDAFDLNLIRRIINEGKFEVKVYDDSFSIKSLSEIHSITVHKFNYNEQHPLENKIYQVKTLYKNSFKFVFVNLWRNLLCGIVLLFVYLSNK